MSPDETWRKLEKIPLRPRCIEKRLCINAETVKNKRQLIHERDIQIPLSILNDFCCLSNLDAWGSMNSRLHNYPICLRDDIERFRVLSRYDFHDLLERVLFISGIDALWRISNLEVN